jgi:predicted RecB family endonuclease
MSERAAASIAEEVVAEALARGLRSTDRWWQNQRITDDRKNAEIDFVLVLPGSGVVAVEVKGGQITHDGSR